MDPTQPRFAYRFRLNQPGQGANIVGLTLRALSIRYPFKNLLARVAQIRTCNFHPAALPALYYIAVRRPKASKHEQDKRGLLFPFFIDRERRIYNSDNQHYMGWYTSFPYAGCSWNNRRDTSSLDFEHYWKYPAGSNIMVVLSSFV